MRLPAPPTVPNDPFTTLLFRYALELSRGLATVADLRARLAPWPRDYRPQVMA